MITLTVTSNGQITLTKDLQNHLGIHPGAKIIVERLPVGRKISDAFDVLKRHGAYSLSIDEMNQLIADSWAGNR